ncbi:MAG: DUF1877 family protein [Deltaproteobacteria bacterium]|nr:DUF1877 family protein [Deltaproteobacteria bacterium]
MHALLITMSSKRLALIQEDPDALADVVEARHETEIPGLLDLGTAWNALDALLSEGGKDTILGDAVLARSGEPFDTDFKSARLLAPARVAEIAKTLGALKIKALAAKHEGDPEEREALELLMKQLAALYTGAAKQQHSILALLV